jgi:hypothetical protein
MRVLEALTYAFGALVAFFLIKPTIKSSWPYALKLIVKYGAPGVAFAGLALYYVAAGENLPDTIAKGIFCPWSALPGCKISATSIPVPTNEEAQRAAHEEALKALRGAEASFRAEQQRLAEERRKAEEQQRLAEERRKAEEQQRVAEERRKAEEQQRVAEERRKAEEQQRAASLPCPYWVQTSLSEVNDQLIRNRGHWPTMLVATRQKINLIETACNLNHPETKDMLAGTLATHGIANVYLGNRSAACPFLLRSRRLRLELGDQEEIRLISGAVAKTAC